MATDRFPAWEYHADDVAREECSSLSYPFGLERAVAELRWAARGEIGPALSREDWVDLLRDVRKRQSWRFKLVGWWRRRKMVDPGNKAPWES